MELTVKNFVDEAKKWNIEVFGNILRKKRELIARIKGIQRCLENYYSRKLVHLEKEMREELEVVLDNEELLWKQKSRNDWLEFGDKNSRYFHSQVHKRRHCNRILSLKLSDDLWSHDEVNIKEEVVGFFQRLYTEGDSHGLSTYLRGCFPYVDNQLLSQIE